MHPSSPSRSTFCPPQQSQQLCHCAETLDENASAPMKTPCSADDGSAMRSRTELDSSEDGGWAGDGVWPEHSELGAAASGIAEPVGGHHQSLLTALRPTGPMKTIAG